MLTFIILFVCMLLAVGAMFVALNAKRTKPAVAEAPPEPVWHGHVPPATKPRAPRPMNAEN